MPFAHLSFLNGNMSVSVCLNKLLIENSVKLGHQTAAGWKAPPYRSPSKDWTGFICSSEVSQESVLGKETRTRSGAGDRALCCTS